MGSRKYRIHTRSRAKAGLVSKFLLMVGMWKILGLWR